MNNIELEQIIGMTDDAAYKLLSSKKIKHRLAKNNGKSMMLTRDFNPDRVNLDILDSRVVGYTKG